uniref:Uncharacterized protein n=1 Tax=Oscillatoriales cyanobacterium SpSt-402 TaxID=2282168 RepID=A0A832M3E1_9CYAN
MKTLTLPIKVFDFYAEPPPRRQLKIACEITNTASFDICILDAWIIVETLNGLKLAEGKIFQTMHNRVDPAIIPSGKSGLGAIHIDLPVQVLQHIEERRAGGDIKLLLSSRVLVSEVLAVDAVKTLGIPFETGFGSASSDRFEYLIPQSEWIKVLKRLAWSELELLELPVAKIKGTPALTRAVQRFEDAQDCYRRGDWAETMMNCRKAFEATIKDTTGENDLKEASKALEFLIGEARKAEPLNEVVKNLGDFLHLARHEQFPPIPIKPEDARLALHLTGALLAYLGR